jgi:hypothetical protein
VKTRISAIIAICCLAVVTPAFGKKKGKGGNNPPTSEEVTPPKTDDGTGTKPTTDAGTTPPTAAPPADAGATALPTAPPPLTGNLTTLSGKTYEAVALKRVDPDGLLIIHRSGEAKVLLTDLPENVRARYYDAKTVAAFQAGQATEAERQAKGQKAAAEKQKREERVGEFYAGTNTRMRYKVVQRIDLRNFLVRRMGDSSPQSASGPILWLKMHHDHDVNDKHFFSKIAAAPTGRACEYTSSDGVKHTVNELEQIDLPTFSNEDSKSREGTAQNAQAEQRQAESTGISYDQITGNGLGGRFSMEKSTDVDRRQRFTGWSANGNALLEVIGSTSDIFQATLVIALPKDSDKTVIENGGFALRFLGNIDPTWDSSVREKWFFSAASRIQKGEEKVRVMRGTNRVTLADSPLGLVISVFSSCPN